MYWGENSNIEGEKSTTRCGIVNIEKLINLSCVMDIINDAFVKGLFGVVKGLQLYFTFTLTLTLY